MVWLRRWWNSFPSVAGSCFKERKLTLENSQFVWRNAVRYTFVGLLCWKYAHAHVLTYFKPIYLSHMRLICYCYFITNEHYWQVHGFLIVQAITIATWSRHGRSIYRRGTCFAIVKETTRMCDLFWNVHSPEEAPVRSHVLWEMSARYVQGQRAAGLSYLSNMQNNNICSGERHRRLA